MNTPSPTYDIDVIRAGIPILRHAIPMNNCSQAPLTDSTRAAADDFLHSWNRRGMEWDRWIQEVDAARAMFARLINAHPDEIAAVTSLSHAANVIASALRFGEGRPIIVTGETEFPTVAHVWRAQERGGATIRWIDAPDGAPDEDAYINAVDERCALVSVTHAYYVNGAMSDIDRIGRAARAHGALVFVDAYQSAGTTRFDVKASPIDFLAAGTLKYLMGTSGLAFLYVRRELIERLHPTVTGWFGRANPFAFDAARLDWADRATRFEAGTPAIFPAYIARAGMSMLLDTGLDAIGSWNAELSRRLVDGGRDRGLMIHGPGLSRPKTPTTAFRCRGDSHAVESALRGRGVIASARGPAIRLAPHFYTTLDDVDQALDALADILRQDAAA